MAYTIIRSDGNVLTTIQDGTINTTSTSLGLPGRNYAGYGQTLDTNMVRMLENFANDSIPSNPIRGQLWYNTNTQTLSICPTDGEANASNWITLSSVTSAGNAVLGNLQVTGNITGNNISVTNAGDFMDITCQTLTAANTVTAGNASIASANLTTTRTTLITTGAVGNAGTMTGAWTVNGAVSGNALIVTGGNIYANVGFKSNNYYWANGNSLANSIVGAYSNANVQSFMSTTAGNGGFSGNLYPGNLITNYIGGGGTIANVWTLASGARIQATYADLAERYEADAEYPVGTVVEIGGEKEITAVKEELSDEVFGVISKTAAYLMNSGAGDDVTHPPVALAGRVKVLVVGQVKKGQRLVSAGGGKARAGLKEELTPFNVIGRALEHKDSDGEGIIEAVVIAK